MKSEIKQRIDQLNNGVIPDGYKKTEVSVFPCDWETRQLSQLLDFKNGINADKDKYHSGVKMISVNDILTDRPIVYDSIQGQVDIDEDTLKEFGVSYGDILFQRSSETFEDAGKSNVYLDPDKTSTYSGFVIRGKKKAEYEPYYLNEALRIGQVRKQIIRRAAGSQHINVGQDSLASVTIPFATLQEQSKITEILMKWDKAIELYQQQIEKLSKLKRAALANLFPQKGQTTPKYRFAGFTDPWEQRKFIDLYDYASEGGTPDTNNPAFYEGGKIPFVKIEDTVEKYINFPKSYITEEGINHSSAWLIPKDSVIFTNGATVGNVAINRLPVATKQGILGIIPSKKVTSEFLFYLLSSTGFQREVRSRMATGTFATIILKSLNEIPVCFPSNTNEQESISTVLSGIDTLITLHQRKCEKIMRQRKVLQQYLLNGFVRV